MKTKKQIKSRVSRLRKQLKDCRKDMSSMMPNVPSWKKEVEMTLMSEIEGLKWTLK